MTEKLSGEHQKIWESVEAMRSEHEGISESVNSVGSKVDKLERDLEVHIAEGHALYVQRTEIESMFSDFIATVKEWLAESRADRKRLHATVGELTAKTDMMTSQQDILAEVVLGRPERDIDGQIVRMGGMAEIVHDYHNGGKRGIKTQLPDYFWTKLIFTLMTVASTIIAAFIMAG